MTPPGIDVVIAHQGGWDELLLFAVPVVIALAAVKLVEMRNRAAAPPGDEGADGANQAHGDG